MSGKRRYLLSRLPRPVLADALLEYRAFAADHPDDELSECCSRWPGMCHLALHDERMVARAVGERSKPNAELKISQRQRRQLRRARLARLAKQAGMVRC